MMNVMAADEEQHEQERKQTKKQSYYQTAPVSHNHSFRLHNIITANLGMMIWNNTAPQLLRFVRIELYV